MEIFLNKRAMRQVRLSVADAIADGEIDALREDLVSVFSDDNIEEIERRIDSGDFYDFITEILEEWSGEDLRRADGAPRNPTRRRQRGPEVHRTRKRRLGR